MKLKNADKLEKNDLIYSGHEKIIDIDIGDISQPTNDGKILKIRGLL